MAETRTIPIRRLLTLVIVGVCFLIGVGSCIALGAYQWFEFRAALIHDTSALALVTADESRAALTFQDDAAAREVLRALQSVPSIHGAALFNADGSRFAEFLRDGSSASHINLPPTPEGHRFGRFHLAVYRPVMLNGKKIGTVRLEADLAPMYRRLEWFALIAFLVMLASVPVAVVLAHWLQRPITRPILALTETARGVEDRSDYQARAQARGWREIGLLSDAFNAMLGRIAERETLLAAEKDRAHAQLGRLELLHRITRAIGERQDLASIFQVVVRTVEQDLPTDFACLCVYDDTAQMLNITSIGVRSEKLTMELVTGSNSRIEIEPNGLTRCIAGQLVYEPDIRAHRQPFFHRLAREGITSFVAAPLLVESRVFGALLVGRRTPQTFASGECEFIKQLSEHVALASHQAQLHQALQQAYDDLRQTQNAVMQQERLRALGEMASGIAHDINNAISPVALYAESLIEREPNLSPRAKTYLETIQRAVEDVAETVARMREFYRKGEATLETAPVDLNRLIQQVQDLTRARWSDMAQQKGIMIQFEQELADDLPKIAGVESEMREAMVNLVFNAVDAMPEGGTLTLRTRVVRNSVLLEVSDTGTGMSEETRRRCLEPFFTTKGERGTGLGLAMVYGIVRRHNAEIEIESEVGKGTTMRITFPIGADMGGDSATAPEEVRPSRMRILVVDDDPLLIQSLRDALESDGHVVATANGGQVGINLFRTEIGEGKKFDAVITDLGMPYVDGRKVAAAVKGASADTPVLMLTGWGRRMTAEGDIPPHVDRVLNKPPKLRELREALAQCLAKADGKGAHG